MQQEIIRIDLNAVNCYLLKSKEDFILIDTGGHTILDKQFSNRRDLLEKELNRAGCNEKNLKLVLLTHGDNDHVANAVYLRDKYNTKIAMCSEDLPLVENPNIDMVMKSFNYRSFVYKLVFVLMKKKIEEANLQVLNDFKKFTPDILIDDNFSLLDFGFDASILHLPGHTPGSIGVLMSNGDLISGDIFANNNKPDMALNAIDFKLLAESIDKLKQFKIKTVYPGHGKPFNFSELK